MEFHSDFNVNNLEKIIVEPSEKGLGEKILKLEFMGGGSYGRVFKATTAKGGYALKAYRRKGMQESEAFQLKILAENTPVPMPKVLFTFENENLSLLAMTLIEGKNVLNPEFIFKSRTKKNAFSKDVIKGMLSWHEVTGDRYGFLNEPTYENWHEFYKKEKVEKMFNLLRENESKISPKKLELLEKATEIYEKIGDEPEEPVLIHGDLNIMNMMADPKSFKLTGFIDPYSSMWANREYDLFQLRNMWGDSFGLYEEYKKQYPLSKESDFRVAYYGAVNEMLCSYESGEAIALWQNVCLRALKREMKYFR